MRRRFGSLQLGLAVRLMALYVAVTAIAAGVLIYRAYDTAGSLNDRELALRADDLAASVLPIDAGKAGLDLPPSLVRAYTESAESAVYAIRMPNGQVIAASPPEFGDRVKSWPAASNEPSYFRLSDVAGRHESYYGLTIALDSAAGPLWVTVAHAGAAGPLVQALLWEFVADLFWGIPALVLVTTVVVIWAIRKGLKPVREISRQAAAIGPNTTSLRLPEARLPREIAPLVAAVNRALDRLELGFIIQRQFTANAAHELRTPLAIVTGALDAMDDNVELGKLKADVARMNRLVEQLLRVARLDAVGLDVSGSVDLTSIAADTVAMLAPWAIAQRREIVFADCGGPVCVRGNGPAIADAIRNLIENAVTHSPGDGEIIVSVGADRAVSVADRGPGVAEHDRAHVFERFWRGQARTTDGAGLGLAITREIMKAHGGSVAVTDNPQGGAVFTLSFECLREEARSNPVCG